MDVLLVGKETNRAQRTRGTHCKGAGGFFHMSLFFPFSFFFKKIPKNKKRKITHEKENDKAGPDQPTEEVEETIYGTHPRNETKKGREEIIRGSDNKRR